MAPFSRLMGSRRSNSLPSTWKRGDGTLKVLAIAALAVGLIAQAAHADTFRFGQNPDWVNLPYDISITKVSIHVPDMKYGGFGDYCFGTMRFTDGVYPVPIPGKENFSMGRGGFVEPLCFNTTRYKAIEGWVYPTEPQEGPVLVPAGDWDQTIDLADTPYFLAAGTALICNSLGTISSVLPTGSMNGTCTVEYERYEAGEPRYRFIRLPYFDQSFNHAERLVTSYFEGYDSGHPLEIASGVAYIGNNLLDSHMIACLRKEQEDGTLIKEMCLPEADQDSPGQFPIDWTINVGERIALDCHYPADDLESEGDCAVYLLAKLPDDLALSWENSFRDYGEMPRGYVTEWCEQTADAIAVETHHDPILCGIDKICSRAERVANCQAAINISVFPEASCMAGGSCFSE